MAGVTLAVWSHGTVSVTVTHVAVEYSSVEFTLAFTVAVSVTELCLTDGVDFVLESADFDFVCVLCHLVPHLERTQLLAHTVQLTKILSHQVYTPTVS